MTDAPFSASTLSGLPPQDISPADLEVQKRITDLAQQLFMTHGFSKVTMEEVAQELGMSKKTLYKHFPNKEALLRGVALRIMREGDSNLGAILQDPTLAFPKKLERLMVAVGTQSARVAPQIIKDIRANAPNVWTEIYAFRQRRIAAFGGLMKEGMEQGYLRTDLDQHIVMELFLGAVERVMNPENLAEGQYTPHQGLRTLIVVLFEGLLTERGRAEYTHV